MNKTQKRIIIDGGEITRTAVLSDGKLTELFIDDRRHTSIAGNIYKGIVQNILPGGFAFIDIGQPKNGFLNLEKSRQSLKPGGHVTVQVRKDAVNAKGTSAKGTSAKGTNLSTDLQFKGPLAILSPGGSEIGLSQKIKEPSLRKKLKKTAQKLLPYGYSALLRTNAQFASEEELIEEFARLESQSESLTQRAEFSAAPVLLHKTVPLLTDLLSAEVGEIITNAPEILARLEEELPDEHAKKLRLLQQEPLFERFGIEKQIAKALNRKLWLPCGGFVTFDEVEACVVIDVNTGKFGGKGTSAKDTSAKDTSAKDTSAKDTSAKDTRTHNNYTKTVLTANLEAAALIARQIALRNLSGMIIVDFIDMPAEESALLLARFAKELAHDRIPPKIAGMTQLGLVQLTREKRREPLSRLLMRECECCRGAGRVKANLTDNNPTPSPPTPH